MDADSLDSKMLASKSFHLICSPARASELVHDIRQKRQLLNAELEPPLWVWEPFPDSCVPSKYEAFRSAMSQVDVVSPNHSELCGLFGVDAHDSEGDVHRQHVEHCTDRLLDADVGHDGNGSVVVRAGKNGCLIARNTDGKRWLPAFHTDQSMVVDPTGGGNAFCGALAVTLVRDHSTSMMQKLEGAAVAGAVAASYVVEQVGVPRGLTAVNGANPAERLNLLRSKMAA